MTGKICIIDGGISGLILSKVLSDLNIKIDLINRNFSNKKKYRTRSIAISRSNFLFLKNLNILTKKQNLFWKIKEIRLFNTKINHSNKMIFDFKNPENTPIFYMIKNDYLYLNLKKKINNNPLISFKNEKYANNIFNSDLRNNNKDYDLIINCSDNNILNKNIYFKKIKKNYKAIAFTTVIKHEKNRNDIAFQYFTKFGPMAFLPLSEDYTSVVWSVSLNFSLMTYKEIKSEIKKLFNSKAKKISFSPINKFKLDFSVPRDYFKNNVLIFGDGSHKIHPLAGQGLNMTIRDVKIFKSIVENRLSLGLPLDQSILQEFTNKTKSYNYLFAKGIDFTEKYFSINNEFFNSYSNKFFQQINKNLYFKEILMRIADKGLNI